MRSEWENSSRQLNIPERLTYTVLLDMSWRIESIEAATNLPQGGVFIIRRSNKTMVESIPTG
ncbi:MAG: hypothetical protein D6723_12295 [Acidobacteria bacterium]|nr:MAG: hypothetical protein D6723_12295 [Acidobacteriota bacterium]